MYRLMGGSVNQKVVPYAQKENVFLIAGFNLPLILELAMNEDKVTKEELIDGSVLYLRIYFLGMPALAVYNCGNAISAQTVIQQGRYAICSLQAF